jgi:hypothetical protein
MMNLQSTLLKHLGQDFSPTPVLDDLFLALDRDIQVWINRGLTADKLEAIGKVLVHAAETFGSAPKAERWLKRPNPLLDGRPLDRIERDPQAIDDELTRIDHGVYV